MSANHRKAVADCVSSKGNLHDVARKIYLSYPTAALIDLPDIEYEIRQTVSEFFDVGIHCVQVAGSAKTGFSFHQDREFVAGESDLDLAIISHDHFLRYCEMVSKITRNYSDLSGFQRTPNDISHSKIMLENIAHFGMFNFVVMPRCNEKNRVNGFFGSLSKRHNRLFKRISVAIYASAYFFEMKQQDSLSKVFGKAKT